MTVFPLAEWRPDISELNSGFTSDLLNVMPADGSYMPFKGLEPFTGAVGGPPLAGFLARSLAGELRIFAGTPAKLFLLNNTTLAWDDVSKPATTYAASDEAKWSFAQFGTFVIAVNQNDSPQVYDLGTSTEFRDLGGSPPRAGLVKIWGDFVALMQLTSNPDRVHWSGLNDCEFWTPGSQNSDYQTFPDGGVVQGSTEATNPLIFQERAIVRGTFVPGSVEVFTFQKIHDLRGAKSASSIAQRGAYAFFADEGGFFQIGPDGSLSTIGYEKVDRTIFGRLSTPDIRKIKGAVDPFFSRVYWAADFGGTGSYDTVIVYDWNLQRWSQVKVSISTIFPAATTGYTLESLDSISGSLDALPFSLDSKVWQGGAPIMAAFSLDRKFCFFTGDNMEATITTQEMGDVSGGVVRMTSTYAVVDTDEVYVSMGIRLRRTDPVVWLPEQVPSYNTGRIRKLARSRFHRFKLRIPAGVTWTHCQAIDAASQPAGQR